MDEKKFKTLVESIAVVMACQSVLFNLLVKDGFIKKEEAGLNLDILFDGFNKDSVSPIALEYIKGLRESISTTSPYQYPTWLQDMIDGQPET